MRVQLEGLAAESQSNGGISSPSLSPADHEGSSIEGEKERNHMIEGKINLEAKRAILEELERLLEFLEHRS